MESIFNSRSDIGSAGVRIERKDNRRCAGYLEQTAADDDSRQGQSQ
jgi:hypothetical protein